MPPVDSRAHLLRATGFDDMVGGYVFETVGIEFQFD